MHHILHHCDSKNPYTGDKCTVNNAVTCDFRSLWPGGRRRSNVCLWTLAVKRECNQIRGFFDLGRKNKRPIHLRKAFAWAVWDGLDGLVRGKSASLALLSLLATYGQFMRLSSFPNPGTLQEFGPLLRSKFASRTAEWFAGCPDAWHSNTLPVLSDPVEIFASRC